MAVLLLEWPGHAHLTKDLALGLLWVAAGVPESWSCLRTWVLLRTSHTIAEVCCSSPEWHFCSRAVGSWRRALLRVTGAGTDGPGGLGGGQGGGAPGWLDRGREGWQCPQGPDKAAGWAILCLGRWFKPLWGPRWALAPGRCSCRGQRSHGAKQPFSDRGGGILGGCRLRCLTAVVGYFSAPLVQLRECGWDAFYMFLCS